MDCYDDVTPTFLSLSTEPSLIKDVDTTVLERFTILLYSSTSTIVNLDEARSELFTRKEGQWTLFLQPKQLLCNISEEQFTKVVTVGERCYMFAWTCQLLKTGDGLIHWKPLWITLPEASVSSRELLCCGCKKGCTAGRCKCKKAALNCTAVPMWWGM